MKRLTPVFLVISLFMGPAIAAVPTELSKASVQSWSLAQGLPEESIYAIGETPDGYIWIATRDGLVRFDGLNFKVLAPGQHSTTRDNGLGGIAYSKGALWVGSRDYFATAKPDRFDSFTNLVFSVTPFPREPADRFGIALASMRPNGDILFQRADGIYSVSPGDVASRPKLLYSPPPGETLRGFHEGNDGRAWIITQSGIKVRERDRWKPLPALPTLPHTMLQARDRSLWFLASDDLYHLAGSKLERFQTHSPTQLEPLRGLLEDSDGSIWFAAIGSIGRIRNGRMERLDLKGRIQPDDALETLFQSKDGAIWGGTGRGSLVRIQARTFDLVDHADGLSTSIVSSVVEDSRSRLWIGTRTGGIYTNADGQATNGTTWRKAFQTAGPFVSAMTPLPDGKLLIADSQGLWQSDGSSARLLLRSTDQSQVRFSSFSPIRDSHLYYSNPTTIYRLDLRPNADPAISAIAAVALVRGMVDGPDGLWAVSWDRGLIHVEPGRITDYPLDSVHQKRGFTIYPLDSNTILVGTSTGVVGFDRRSQRYIPRPTALAEEQIFFILPDRRGDLWFAGRKSLQVVDLTSVRKYFLEGQSEITPTRLTSLQGLGSANFGLGTSSVGTLASNGEIWLASLGGAVHFQPSVVAADSKPARCAISKIIADQEEIPFDGLETPRVKPGTRRVQIEYTALDRKAGENLLFRHHLDGDDTGWLESSTFQAYYNNLQPGDYRFHLEVRAGSRGWVDALPPLPFTVAPYWYQRRLIQAAGVIALLALIAAGIHVRNRQVQRQTEELEARVRERTEQLAQARDEAERSRTLAESAARVKSDFLATMSHEIRTPMNGVIGMIDLLVQTELTEEQRELTQIIASSGDTLLGIVNDILDLSKIEAGGIELEDEPFSVVETVGHLREIFSVQASAKNLRFETQIDPDVPLWVSGDVGRVRQILVNLLSNALKFTQRGSVTLHVQREVNGLRFIVADTGIGIPLEKQSLIFQPFTQAESSTTRRFGGTGLGLAICQRLTLAMGGTIQVESTAGQGSRFTVTLPLPSVERTRKGAPAGDHVDSHRVPIGFRVLVVEDNMVNQRLAVSLLKRLGCHTVTAVDGVQAVLAAERESFDLILMDCHMPELDGYEATRRIRQLTSPSARVPIVAVTANALAEDRQRCIDCGMDDHLAKPIRLDDLRAVIEHVAECAASKSGDVNAELRQPPIPHPLV